MYGLLNRRVTCPYCGETIELVIDCSIEAQRYIEDCAVCCRPVNLFVSINDDEVRVIAKHENEI